MKELSPHFAPQKNPQPNGLAPAGQSLAFVRQQSLELFQPSLQAAATALLAQNETTSHHGLVLCPAQAASLALCQQQSLHATGRIEFGEGILPRLAATFCSSPHISPTTYEETLAGLTECFYHYKTEACERFSDDELLAVMKAYWDGSCQGSLELLAGITLAALCHGEETAPPSLAPFACNGDDMED